MKIHANVHTAGVSRYLTMLYRDQAPYATSIAINETAKAVQGAERGEMQRRFRIRRPWVLQGVKIFQWAKKHALKAIVGIDQQRDFLEKFEAGETKRPRGQRIAIPSKARRTKADVVSKGQRPRSFAFTETSPGVFKGNRRTFMIQRPGGKGYIVQRTGRGKRSGTKLLYVFQPQARTPKLLHFAETAKATITKVWPAEMRKAMAKAIATARR